MVRRREEPGYGATSTPGSVVPDGQEGAVQTLANSYAFWILLVPVLAIVYLLPTLVGLIRRVDALGLVFLVNLIGAPTGVGWLAAMILAFGPRRMSARPLDSPRGYRLN